MLCFTLDMLCFTLTCQLLRFLFFAFVHLTMVKKRVDPLVNRYIKHAVKTNHRSMWFIVGDKGNYRVSNLYQMISKAQVPLFSAFLPILFMYTVF